MTPEERVEEKARRMLEKSMRMPVNDVILEVQKGIIDINDLFSEIILKVKEGERDG